MLAETKAGEGGGGKSMYHARFMKLSWSFGNGGTGQSADAGTCSESRRAGEWMRKASNDLIGHRNAGVTHCNTQEACNFFS